MAKEPYNEQDTRSVLYDTIDILGKENGIEQSEELKNLIEALKQLNEYQSAFYKRDSKGIYSVYGEEDNKKMLSLYENSIKAADAYLGTKTDKEKETGAANATDFLNKLLLRDRNYLKTTAITPDADLPMLLNSARSFTVNITGVDLEVWGAAQSKRMPMTVKDRNGKKITGVFTPKRIVDVQTPYNNMINEISSCYLEAGDIFTNLLDDFRKVSRAGQKFPVPGGADFSPTIQGNEYDIFPLLGLCMKDNEFDYDRTSKVISLVTGKTVNELENTEGFVNAAKTFCALSENFYTGEGISMLNLNLKTGARIDSRNAAMSTVSALLGRKDLICPAFSMTVVNGKEKIEGTFMEMAKGVDPAHPTDSAKLYSPRNDSIKEALVSVADLQVIDYICGNVDRHAFNYFYRLEGEGINTRLVGLTGIDNDASFGELDKPVTGKLNQLVGTDNMRVVSSSMAEKLNGITEEMLRYSLRTYELSEKSIKSACDRLTHLKQCIKDSQLEYSKPENIEKIKNDPGFTIKGKIRVMPDEDFAKVTVSRFGNNGIDRRGRAVKRSRQENLFDKVASYSLNRRAEPRAASDPEYVTDNSRFSRDAMRAGAENTERLIRQLTEATTRRGTSPEYERMKESLINLQKIYDNNSDREPDFDSVMEINKGISKLKKSCFDYLEHKKSDKHPSDYAKNRIRLATDVFEFAKEQFIDLDKISETEKQNLRNNEERNIQKFNKEMLEQVKNAPEIVNPINFSL